MKKFEVIKNGVKFEVDSLNEVEKGLVSQIKEGYVSVVDSELVKKYKNDEVGEEVEWEEESVGMNMMSGKEYVLLGEGCWVNIEDNVICRVRKS